MTAPLLTPVCDTLADVLRPTSLSAGAFYTLKDGAMSCTFSLARPAMRRLRGHGHPEGRGPWVVSLDIEASPAEALVWLNRDRHRTSKLRDPDRASLERVVDRLYGWAQRQHARWSVILDIDRRITAEMARAGARFGDALAREITRTTRPLDYDLMSMADACEWAEWLDKQRGARGLDCDTVTHERRA